LWRKRKVLPEEVREHGAKRGGLPMSKAAAVPTLVPLLLPHSLL
jgi:hypothetical protein